MISSSRRLSRIYFMKSLRKKFKVLSVLLALALPSFSLLGDLSNGLVAWYPFDGNASDMSGNGNHGIVYGATLGTDRHGHANKAYNFDGNGDYISIPASSSLNITNEGSICFWMNRRINQAGSYYKSFLFCRLKDGFPNGSSSFSDHSWFIIQLYDTSSYPMRWYDGVRVGKTQINKWEHYIFTQNESSEAFLFENGFLIDDGDGVSWGGSNQPIMLMGCVQKKRDPHRDVARASGDGRGHSTIPPSHPLPLPPCIPGTDGSLLGPGSCEATVLS